MNLYYNLASARDILRRAKDHHDTIKAIVELQTETTGKNADDRKRELVAALSLNKNYVRALTDLRNAEAAVDQAQALIDAAEAERREREWQTRQRLAEVLSQHHVETEDDIPDWLQDRRAVTRAKQQMDELYT